MTPDLLRELHRSLDRQPRPEDLLTPIQALLGARLSAVERTALILARRSAQAANPWGWSSMADDFRRPVGLERQLSVASQLFQTRLPEDSSDLAGIDQYLHGVTAEIEGQVGAGDFQRDRLSRAARAAAGLELNNRQYNKRFRLAVRMARKRERFARGLEQRALTLISKSRLASELPYGVFAQDPDTAAFIAYFTARCHRRSVFTNAPQQRPYDEIADLLFARCRRSPGTVWWAIAHVHPTPEVLGHLSAAQRGELLGRFYAVLDRSAALMREVWAHSNIDRSSMVVRRGNDSSTWNLLAGAWNQARDGWINLLYALDADEVLDAVCPGKAMRLMAADVAAWHRLSGGGLDPNTEVWSALPLPWTVITGETRCTRSDVLAACQVAGLDPATSGWIAPRAAARVQPFTPTPELVHGVTVGHPGLAQLLRRAGVFSGKP